MFAIVAMTGSILLDLAPFTKRHARSFWLVFLFAVVQLSGDILDYISKEFLERKIPPFVIYVKE